MGGKSLHLSSLESFSRLSDLLARIYSDSSRQSSDERLSSMEIRGVTPIPETGANIGSSRLPDQSKILALQRGRATTEIIPSYADL